MTCKSHEDLLMHDVPDPDKWLAALDVQPASGWDGTVTYAGWQHVPSVFVVAKHDRVLPAPLQLQLAELAGSQVKEIEAGHMLQLAKPAEVAAIIQEAAAS
jgi:pimeloyl-ACP methyl ester carboxylesterase